MTLKILILSYEYAPIGGGGGVFTKRLATGLAEQNDFQVDVVTGYHSTLPRKEKNDSLRIWRVGIPRKNLSHVRFREMLSYSTATSLWTLRHGHSYDIVNSHFAVPSAIGALPLRYLRRKTHVLTLLGSDVYNPFEYKLFLEIIRPFLRFLYHSADLLITPSDELRQRCNDRGTKRPICVIPHGIDVESYNKIQRPTKKGLVVCTSRLIPRKAHQYLIAAMSHVIREMPEAKLCFIGDGPELGYLKTYSQKCGIQDNIEFTGHLIRDEKISRIAEADLFALHTLHEAFGLVYLEAMSLGKPVVTTTEGAGKEVVGEAGLFVPVRDPVAMSKAILKLLLNRELRDKKGQAGLERIQKFNWSKIIEKYKMIFERLIE